LSKKGSDPILLVVRYSKHSVYTEYFDTLVRIKFKE